MKLLQLVTLIIALALAAGEIGRWWGDARFLPLAFDELLVALGMAAAVPASRRFGAAPLAAAWGAYCGLVLGLLVPTLDHLLFGPPKESATFYAVVLALLLAVGVWATVRALRLSRAPSP